MPEPLIVCEACRTEFFRRALRCPQCSAIGVRFLYKYRALNEYARTSLTESTLWCPPVNTLNDPFEFSFALTEMQIHGVPIEVESVVKATEAIKRYGVISMSEVCDNILMWTHYADTHKGFCMKFERADDNPLGAYDNCLPVIYTIDYPTFSLHELEDPKTVARIMTGKSKEWQYEHEWRMLVKPEQNSQPFPGVLRAIIFGCRMSVASRREIAGVLGEAVEYSEAVISKTSFSLTFRQVPYNTLV